ncbi:MAG: hypothetical protein U1E26_08165 [Coriobacteriia bacterium]|nr:hypothetical protein [Coriobacteriia bacterium]
MPTVSPTKSLADGRTASAEILEITALPYWELVSETIAGAADAIDSLFARLVNDLHRRDDSGDTSAELLFVTTPAKNQTYRAQTRIFFIVRGMGGDCAELAERLAVIIKNAEFSLREGGYAVERLVSDAQWKSFSDVLSCVSDETISAIARQERVVGGQTGIGLYYTDVVTPAIGDNFALVTNTLSQCLNSAVSLQLIPTRYSETEQLGIAQRRAVVDAVRAQILMTPGAVVPSTYSDAAVSYVDFVDSQKENIYYFNFLVYAPSADARTLAGKLMDLIQADTQAGSNALTVVDVSGAGFTLADGFTVSPWIHSNRLVYDTRESGFWEAQGAPIDLIRMKYLATSQFVRAAFKAPFDDGRIIGLESKRSHSTRDKLHQTVLAKGSFRIGDIVDAESADATSAQAGVPLNDFARHALVVGASGYGKTNFALGMLLRFWREFNIPFLAIEPTKTEYRSLIDAIPEINIFTPGKNDVSPFIINPFVPPPCVTIESYVPSLMTAFNAAFDMPDPLPGIFRAAINDCYNRYGWKSTSTLDDPHVQRFGFYEFIRVFKERVRRLDYQGETKSNIESAGVVRLTSLIEQNPNIYDTINTLPIEDLLAKPTIIELNAIGDKEQKSLLMALLLVSLCAYTKSNATLDGKLKNIFLIDEAHVLLGSSSNQSPDARSSTVEALEDMIAEVRAYGTGIIIADQSPANVGRNIIANTDIKVMFRLVERQNRDMVGGATNMEPTDEAMLAQLGTGECLLHYGRLNAPLHVKVDDVQSVAPMARSVSDARVHDEVDFWDTRAMLLRPFRECAFSRCCSEGCDFDTRVDADFLASQIATFYLDYLSDWDRIKEMLLFRVAGAVESRMQQVPGVNPSQRLRDCATIKVLRKTLLAKSVAVADAEVFGVLRDERVMPHQAVEVGERSKGESNG